MPRSFCNFALDLITEIQWVMKKIGYIHRYDNNEEKGILVYGYNKGPLWDSPKPILFSKSQCKTSVKTGVLVYFEIDEDETVRDIEYASIFNFDKELLLSYASVYDTKDWNECEKETHICYQNIFELEELIPLEELFPRKEMASPDDINKDDVACEDKNESYNEICEDKDESDEDFDWDSYDFDDELGVPDWDLDEFTLDDDRNYSGMYRKVKVPQSIDEEYTLFGKQFPVKEKRTKDCWGFPIYSLADYEKKSETNQTIIIDILNPSFWIPPIPKSRKNYYGKNALEVKDLFETLVAKRRRNYEKYLSKKRSSRSELQNLSTGMQRVSYPDLFQDDCVFTGWAELLNRLSFTEIKSVYCSYPLLQPVLPEPFCEEYLGILSEDYGFPSVSIAEKYLKNAIRNIRTSTEYSYYKKMIYTIKNCIARHLPGEGVPFCAIERKKLGNITILLGKKQRKVINYIQNQISEANPELPLELRHSINGNKGLLLQIGEFYDFVRELPKEITKSHFLNYRLKELKEKYQEIPDTAHIFLDSYLRTTLYIYLINSLNSGELSPYHLHITLEELPKWIDRSFLSINLGLIESIFSKTNNVSDLKDALEYKYIQENTFIKRYYELAVDRSVEQCLRDLGEWWKPRCPEELQLYILRRALSDYKFKSIYYSDGNNSYNFPVNVKVHSLYDFLYWMNKNTYDNEDIIGYISKNVAEQIQKDILPTLSDEDSWHLFISNIMPMPNANIIKEWLSEAYSKYEFEHDFFEKDCFQEQMAIDVSNKHNTQLIKLIIDKLNPKYRAYAEKRVNGFAKLYLWSLNPTENIDWNCMNLFFAELPEDSQIKVFKYLFFNQLEHTGYDTEIFLNNLLEMLLQSTIELKKRTGNLCPNSNMNKVFTPGKSVSALALLVQILQTKLKDVKSPIKWNELEPTIAKLSDNCIHVFSKLINFFVKCPGWLLISSTVRSDTEYYARNGFVTKINADNVHECVYKVCFYESPIDVNYYEVDYLDGSYIEDVENTLKKNFNCKYDNGGYIISSKDEIRLKEFICRYSIDDECNLMNSALKQDNEIQIYSNYSTHHKNNELSICNCSQFKEVDPKLGLPFCWCKKSPCTQKVFLQPNNRWEYFQFHDLLWVVLREKAELEQIWCIYSEVSSFINYLIQNRDGSLVDSESKPLQKDEEIGEWRKDMSIFHDESFDDDYEDDEWDDDYEDSFSERNTYNRYNGSWAQDVEGYSDDDIDTIFDGDPDAYWNID